MAGTTKSQSSKAFRRDLKIGQELEQKVLKNIQEKYPSAVLIPGAWQRYCMKEVVSFKDAE